MDVLQSLDALWFFHNVLAPKTQQIAPVTDETIKESENLSKLTDQILENLQKESPERVQQPNSCEIEAEISAEINPEIVQHPKSSKIEVKVAAELEPEILRSPVNGMEFKTPAATEKLTERRKRTTRRSRIRRKTIGELNLSSRETSLVSPCFPEYWYWYGNGGYQRQGLLNHGIGLNTHHMKCVYAVACRPCTVE
ncbi:hypothetical protein SLEP1_g6119 [Rubroshorea leprosula]|uniref:Uncharacterized protein n=1 Tax=Rubroshorea leprosula TaxID=152421 RepID=A0AAV5I006_9ROSI|nr:hypothetical protein SLEP1_g6119 [Rubroshorea leprosula]